MVAKTAKGAAIHAQPRFSFLATELWSHSRWAANCQAPQAAMPMPPGPLSEAAGLAALG